GGRIYEVLSTGVEADWGVVTRWEPPSRVVIDWNPSPEVRPYTEVEVTFSPVGDGTRVELEHRNWDRLGDEVGTRWRADYDVGWVYVFDERFGRAAD
ncbi:MAG: SRPBCC domain-containing protein, partial [Actinomycetota bacterium]